MCAYTLLGAVKDKEIERAKVKLLIYLLSIANKRVFALRYGEPEASGHSICKTRIFGIAQSDAKLVIQQAWHKTSIQGFEIPMILVKCLRFAIYGSDINYFWLVSR